MKYIFLGPPKRFHECVDILGPLDGHSIICAPSFIMHYLSDNVDAEVEPLEAGHAEEGAGLDLLDEIA